MSRHTTRTRRTNYSHDSPIPHRTGFSRLNEILTANGACRPEAIDYGSNDQRGRGANIHRRKPGHCIAVSCSACCPNWRLARSRPVRRTRARLQQQYTAARALWLESTSTPEISGRMCRPQQDRNLIRQSCAPRERSSAERRSRTNPRTKRAGRAQPINPITPVKRRTSRARLDARGRNAQHAQQEIEPRQADEQFRYSHQTIHRPIRQSIQL